ncbi:hypothetical protein MVEN_02257900 [Mycena venus]|uniref:Uncharacterized protein n=1 Tax=Mycena venus TaxID=2733690 RepID=A0A8H6X6V5_9AGAR|nr:hypothetical protein MVEN_02257900 [Mycena venus]
MATVASASMPSMTDSRARSRSPVKSMPSSPELHRKTSSSELGVPRPPSAADLRPNAHPYPIATTATGILSRANSLSSPSNHPNSGKHHYVPPSPAKEGFDGGKDGAKGKDGGKGKDERRKAEYRGHRYSRSLSSSEDMYLPSSPSTGANGGKDKGEYSGNMHGPRALPVPPGVSANSIAAMNAAAAGSYSAYAASGTLHFFFLAAHLNKTGSPEAGAWATRRNVGGKAFMKMSEMGEEELKGMGAPPSLRPAARALRQEVLQNQLSPSSSASDEEGGHAFPFGRRGRVGSTSPTRGPRVSAVYEEPGEIEDAEEGEDGTPSHRRRTMSVPVASPFPSRPDPNSASPLVARQSPFASRYEYGSPSPGANERPSPSPSPTGGRFRNGRVKGMVRSFESSGSESGSPERERERGGGSGFRSGNGSGFRVANGSGFRRGGSQSDGEEDDVVGGTVRPHGQGHAPGRALPARPDGAEVDLGATVRAYDHAYANGVAPTGTVHANGLLDTGAANGDPKAQAGDEELTIEELLAREDAMGLGNARQRPSPEEVNARQEALFPDAQGPMTPSHTGGAWRKGKRGMGLTPQSTGGSGRLEQHPTGGRPLPAHPSSSSSSSAAYLQRSTSGGVHAWEADDGAVGSTMKWVPARPDVKRVFAGEVSQNTMEAEQWAEKADIEAMLQASVEADKQRAAELKREAAAVRQQREAQEREAQERGRARGAAVRAQLAEAAELRTMVDAFRVRLEEVERKVEEMEVAVDAAVAKQSTTPAPVPATATASSESTTPLTVTQRLDPRRLLALFAQAPASAVVQRNNKSQKEEWVGPTTLTALPSYVLLVGLGVCAVVLRVLVRRGLGAVRGGRGVA